jgi:HPP family
VTRLFALLPEARFEDLRWLAGALAVGISSVVMSATNTVHPPAGATALLAATSPEITALGWYLLALVLLGSTLMLASACVINNIHRRFPVYWWTPVDLTSKADRAASSGIEKVSQAEKEEDFSDAESGRLGKVKTREEMHFDREHEIKITKKRVIIPDWLEINDWERNVLEILRERLNVTLDPDFEWHEPGSRNSVATAVSADEEQGKPPA